MRKWASSKFRLHGEFSSRNASYTDTFRPSKSGSTRPDFEDEKSATRGFFVLEMCPTRTHFEYSRNRGLHDLDFENSKYALHGHISKSSKYRLHGNISTPKSGPTRPGFLKSRNSLYTRLFRGKEVLTIFGVKKSQNAQERCFWEKGGKNDQKTTHR